MTMNVLKGTEVIGRADTYAEAADIVCAVIGAEGEGIRAYVRGAFSRGEVAGLDDMDFSTNRDDYYSMDHAAAQGETVTQGHADYCKKYGHGTWEVNGEVRQYCSRCGALTQAATAQRIQWTLNEGSGHKFGQVTVTEIAAEFRIYFHSTAIGGVTINHPADGSTTALIAQRAEDEMMTRVMVTLEAAKAGGAVKVPGNREAREVASALIGYGSTLNAQFAVSCWGSAPAIATGDGVLPAKSRVITQRQDDGSVLVHVMPWDTLTDVSE